MPVGHRFPLSSTPTRPSPWLMAPVLIAGTWLLSAQAPAPSQVAALEKRVADLEAMISKAGTITRIKGPFQVLADDGKPLLMVADGRPKEAGVLISRTDLGGAVFTLDMVGDLQTGMGMSSQGHGVVYANNKSGKIGSQLGGHGAVAVWNEQGNDVAVMSSMANGKGRVAIWNGETKVAALEDSGSGGALFLMKATGGKPAAMLSTDETGGALRLWNAGDKVSAAVLGNAAGGGLVAVTRANGQNAVEIGVSPDGRGMFQAFLPGGKAIAILGQGGPGDDTGILQIGNLSGIRATLASYADGGMLQLVSKSGIPTVEAGTLPNGRGVVRAGPTFKCLPVQPSTPVMAIPGWTDCIMGSVGK